MHRKRMSQYLALPYRIWIAQLLYVVISLLLLIVLIKDLDTGSVSTAGTRLFSAIYVVIMVAANVLWRLALTHGRRIIFVILVIGAIILNSVIAQIFLVQSAHSSFENYYKFRGCVALVDKSTNNAICRLSSGSLIKIVQFQNRWYLYGDLPQGWF